uniref:SFRICE_040172 n=1 Tax=Spodoptera frugiperda TaxID=7108 RepID=A0A2H1VU13_SPOFR
MLSNYADDTTLFAASEEEMSVLLARLEQVSLELGLHINRAKTKVMIVDRSKSLAMSGTLNLDTVNEFVYLGSTITNNGSCEQDIRRRIGMAKSAMSQLNRVWADRNISRKTKRKLVTTLIFSILLDLDPQKADRCRIDAFEMWCWRKMLGIHWTERRTNESILAELQSPMRLTTICQRRFFDFFGHIARKRGDNLEKLLITGKVDGKRPRGRSPIRWSDQIRATLETTVCDAIHIAEDRTAWRNIVNQKVIRRGHDPQH